MSHCFDAVVSVFALLGCRVGWCAWVFAFVGSVGLFEAPCGVVGVFVWVRWFWGVVGTVGGVGCFTLVWLALRRGVCIMKGVR